MYVYVIKAQDGAFKVGYTGNPEQRIKSLQTASPYKLSYYKLIQLTDNSSAMARRVEKHLLDEFKRWGKSLEGEWYEIKESQVDVILFHLRFRDNVMKDYGLVN